MANLPTYHYPAKEALSSDPLSRIRVTAEGIEPLLYMLVHSLEFHRATYAMTEAIETSATAFGNLPYPKSRLNHGTINERLHIITDEAKQLATSTAATANASLAKLGQQSQNHMSGSGSVQSSTHDAPAGSTSFARPPPSLLGSAGSGASPIASTNFNRSLPSTQFSVGTYFTPYKHIGAFGRPFTLVVTIGKVQSGWLWSANKRIPIEQWRFHCLKTPHAVIMIEDNVIGIRQAISSSNGSGTANLLSNDLSQGRGALRFITDTCFTSAVQSPSVDADAFYNSTPESIYFDLQIERDEK